MFSSVKNEVLLLGYDLFREHFCKMGATKTMEAVLGCVRLSVNSPYLN